MQFLYSLINFLLLTGVVLLFGRKMIFGVFSKRRKKLLKELDEAEAILSEKDKASYDLPLSDEEQVNSELRLFLRRIAEETEALSKTEERLKEQYEHNRDLLRYDMLMKLRAEIVNKLQARAEEILSSEEYISAFQSKEAEMIEMILDKIKLTPGDMAYLDSKDVLYVTLTSAKPLPQETVDEIDVRTKALLEKVGGKTSYWVKTDPTLIGGLRLRIGDTVYDCTVSNRIYHLGKALNKCQIDAHTDFDTLYAEMIKTIRDMPINVDEFQLGRAISVSDGICWLDGLADIMYGEVVEFECGERGMILDIERDRIGCVVFGKYEHIESGSRVRRVGRMASVPVGDKLLGRVVDPLGNPLDGKGRYGHTERRPIECKAPGIPDRRSVSVPLHTGIKAIDSLVPIGRGQRELIIGDRQTGKSSIAVDTIINQKGKGVPCIYVAIGQKETTVAEIMNTLEKHGAMAYTTIVCATASSSASLQYIAPFAGVAMAEYFMYTGRDALIVYDDLSKHAVAYRELSLLLHRPSGREAYPGDVFYLHARLLERAARLTPEAGGGSVTALPIIETQAGDISAYIPTNVISITDGQIFLESDLFNEGQRPAVNVGLSVSRVGSAAQTKLMKQVSSSLRMKLAQYRELVSFSQFGSDVDDNTKKVLRSGELMMAVLRQGRYAPLPEWKQVLLIYAVSEGFASNVGPEKMEEFAERLYDYFEHKCQKMKKLLEQGNKLDHAALADLKQALSAFLSEVR